MDKALEYSESSVCTKCKTPQNGGEDDSLAFPYTSCDPIPLAMAYVPIQQWQNIYDCETALMRGTLFSELDKPFIGEEAVCQ